MTDTDTNPETAARVSDEQAWEEALIADLRANGGRASQGPLKGHPIIVMYSTGAKTGERRRSILTISRDGDTYVVAGTAGGSHSTRRGWQTSKRIPTSSSSSATRRTPAAPRSSARAPSAIGYGTSTSRQLPHFAAYPEQTGRVIPMARIVKTGRLKIAAGIG